MSTDFTKTTKKITTPTTQATTTVMNERYIVYLPSSCDTNKNFIMEVYLLIYSVCRSVKHSSTVSRFYPHTECFYACFLKLLLTLCELK